MCGFVGYVNQTDIPDNTIEKMADRIRHRGPDDEAYFADEGPQWGSVAFRSSTWLTESNQCITVMKLKS